MRIYLAAAYARQAEMQGVRDVLEALGHEITSSWIDKTSEPPGGMGATELFVNPAAGVPHARTDLADLDMAEALVSFTGGGGRGGRHIEFGYALAKGKYLVGVGPREHVFHALANEWYPDVSTLKREFRLGGKQNHEDALGVAAKVMGVRPAFDPGCSLCDTDQHRCPGCGTPTLHGQVACSTCQAL